MPVLVSSVKVRPRNYGSAPTAEERGECLRKQAYITKRFAMAAIGQNEERYGVSFRAYLCPWCYYWHLTTAITEESEGASPEGPTPPAPH